MDWKVAVTIAIVIALLFLTPIVIGYSITRIARQYFPSGLVAESPRLTYVLVITIWIIVIFSLIILNLGIKEESKPTSQNIPNWLFPWPPPAPSAVITIPIPRVLARHSVLTDRWQDIDEALRHALREAGHFEASYYGVPRGFALVTRLESIQADGMPKPGSLRWDTESRNGKFFSISSYIEALFRAPVGRYRVIVFVVTSEQFAAVDAQLGRDDATRWLREGTNTLPLDLLLQPIEPGTLCTALIYEFWKDGNLNQSLLLHPGSISADRHIVGTGLQRLLQ
ncbi:hypothetical protein [Polaromonas glacialis]|uniref:hypothetical protein n=1 Tax=Polaromonas glacialis TaxID=866564 RepID=UPI0012EC6B0D|nr:hypothetical protein [Polaromonas glacialis]